MGSRFLRLSPLLVVLALVATPSAADAAKSSSKSSAKSFKARQGPQPAIAEQPIFPGAKRVTYRYGPIHVVPGQNTIDIEPNQERPTVPGYITRFAPNLVYADGTKVRKGSDGKPKIPRVDVIHLHHGVWVVNAKLTWAAGEEKTIYNLPKGFGWHYKPDDKWLMNYMVHNLTPNPDSVFIEYTIDFVPDSAPEAKNVTEVKTQWMDVENIEVYPVFDALRKDANAKGEFTYPDDADDPYKGGPQKNQWTVKEDATVVWAGGHLHPGGKEDYLTITRNGKTRRMFSSKAYYWEPAGAVSWDVAMTVTPQKWRAKVKKGDIVEIHSTYDVSRASWYESMGIMVLAVADDSVPGVDPFETSTDVPGVLTHGHLAENDHHGGGTLGLPDPAKLLNGPVAKGQLTIDGYVTSQGDLSAGTTKAGRLPTAPVGKGISFVNLDATAAMKPNESAYHTITACKLPCNKEAGIAYPLADGPVDFDSGELGFGPEPGNPFTPTENRNTWTTPTNLKPGTYSYFCRVHPFMRGAFRITGKS